MSFTYKSANLEEGFPGECTAVTTYTLLASGLRVQMEAVTTEICPVNLCNHSYFNLGGHDSGSILDMQLHLNCDQYTPNDDTQVPTGELRSVKGTPLDFTAPVPAAHTLAERINDVKEADGHDSAAGYDHNFVINTGGIGGNPAALTLCADAYDPGSGRRMKVYTNAPGIQLYSGNFVQGTVGKGGIAYVKHAGFCLETQHFPNAINTPNFPSVLLEPGELYQHTMLLQFSVDAKTEAKL